MTNDCGCCAGLAQRTPQELYNRPGLSAIAYRVGDREQFKASLLARLHTSRQRALNRFRFRSRDDDDFTIALFDAFSSMADVLTFYTERIANEAYLRTATERLSVVELAQLIGYQPRPGVAARAWLAFTVEDAPGALGTALVAGTLSQVVPEIDPPTIIDIGAKVQSVPGAGERPQTFETVEKITARADWNAMQPRRTQPQAVSLQGASFILDGAVNTLKAGDTLLLIDAQGNKALKTILGTAISADSKTTQVDVAKPPAYFSATFTPPSLPQGKVDDFAPNTQLNTQVVSAILQKKWDADELATLANQQKWPLEQLSADINRQLALRGKATGKVFVFRKKVSSFGYNAPVWGSLQPILRFDTSFWTGTGSVTLTAPYRSNWENFTLENRASAQGGVRTVFLDSAQAEVVPGSWIALRSPSRAPEGHVAISRVVSNDEVSHTDFTLSAKVSKLRVQQPSSLSAFPIRKTVILCQSENLPLAEVPIPTQINGKTILLDGARLGLSAGRRVVVSGERSDLEGESAAEVRILVNAELIDGFTAITLDSALQYPYKRGTVRINGNVAASTNGETVNELLGNGDASQPFQQFKLKQNPLTYVGAPTPSGGRSTLEVRVDNVLWEEVPYFFGHGPAERIYTTRQDDDAVTWVMFGDGKTGARLPTGQGNVTAKYRKGIGLGGLVRANQLSQMLQRPLGVRGANNPLPASGAADPEVLKDARRNAVLPIMTLGRVVSLQDYQDFARAFSGIEKALATWTWSGEQRVVLLTVAGAKGATVPDGSPLNKSLRTAIAAYSEPGSAPFLYSYDPVFFRVAATVVVEPAFLVDKVRAEVEAKLRSTFSFEAREFGQPVHESEVVAAIQEVTGVMEVDLTQLYRSDQAPLPKPLPHIPAAVPRAGQNEFFPAQLLSLDPRPSELEFMQ